MYCILVTGIPASGKSTMADFLSKRLNLPIVSKDKIKELMYDTIGFNSREEKVALGNACMEIMYYFAEQLLKVKQPFILENNFENVSKPGLLKILQQHNCTAITVCLSGDFDKIYQRFLIRNVSPDRHRGHVVNDCYPEKEKNDAKDIHLSYDNFIKSITARGMAAFEANGPSIKVDTTDFAKIDFEELIKNIVKIKDELQYD